MGRHSNIDAYFDVLSLVVPDLPPRKINGYVHVALTRDRFHLHMLSGFCPQTADIRYADGHIEIFPEGTHYQPVFKAIAEHMENQHFEPREKVPGRRLPLLLGEDPDSRPLIERGVTHASSVLIYRGTLIINPSEWGGRDALGDMSTGTPVKRTAGRNNTGHYLRPRDSPSRYK